MNNCFEKIPVNSFSSCEIKPIWSSTYSSILGIQEIVVDQWLVVFGSFILYSRRDGTIPRPGQLNLMSSSFSVKGTR